MTNETNIVIATVNEEISETLCADCAPRVYAGVEGVELETLYTFSNLERDTPEHCQHCDALLDWDMTDDGLEYIRAEIVAYLSTHIGLSDILQEWHDVYGDYIKEGTRFNNTLTGAQVDDILEVHTVTDHYMAAQLWTGHLDYMTGSNEAGGEPLESGQLDSVVERCEDLPDAIWTSARADVASFIEQVEPYLAYFGETAMTAEQFGHDFSLTRNRHGAGFWDRGYGDLGDWLTIVAHAMGEATLYGAVQLDPAGHCAGEWDLNKVLPETLTVWESN